MSSIKEQVLKIKFSHNWNNKLYCRFFTTIRLANEYYMPGQQYEIWKLDKDVFRQDQGGKPFTEYTHYFNAKLIEKKTFLLDALPPVSAALDTGYPLAETKALLRKMYPGKDWNTQLLDLLLLENLQWGIIK